MADFRERFLIRDAEEQLSTCAEPGQHRERAFYGGVNDSTNFPRWLDQNLFEGATFGHLRTTSGGRACGSTPPTSTTARPLCSAL